jgi:hypothetical protein
VSNEGWAEADKLAVEEADLHQEARDVLNTDILGVLGLGVEDKGAEPCLGSGRADDPVDGGEDVLLHLDESRSVVSTAAERVELVDIELVLAVLKLGGDPQSGATDKLVVLLVDDTARDVAVDNVDSKVEDFWPQAELVVDLNDEVGEEGTHPPLKLWLLVHEVCLREVVGLVCVLDSIPKGSCVSWVCTRATHLHLKQVLEVLFTVFLLVVETVIRATRNKLVV